MAHIDKIRKYRVLKTILENLAPGTEIKRKVLIAAAIDAGLVEKDVYIIIGKKFRSDVNAGHYVRDLMLDKINSKLSVPGESSQYNYSLKIQERKAADPDYVWGISSANEKDEVSEATDWVLPYGEDDIADELSLMGTYL